MVDWLDTSVNCGQTAGQVHMQRGFVLEQDNAVCYAEYQSPKNTAFPCTPNCTASATFGLLIRPLATMLGT